MWAKTVIVCGTASPGSGMCKTKPIRGRPDRHPGADCAKRTQFGRSREATGDKICKTKPISPTGAGLGRGRANVQNKANCPGPGALPSVLGPPTGAIVQNEPNFSIADFGFRIADSERPAARRLGLCGPVVQTNPIGWNLSHKTNPISATWPTGGIPTIPLFYHSSIPIRCLSCKTNPISDGARVRLVIGAALGYHDGVPRGISQPELKKV
jgi:hypothetical protein